MIFVKITIIYRNTVSQYSIAVNANMYLTNLIKIRKQKGWSQEKLASEANISYNTLIKIEKNRIKNPKIETVIKLANALEISIDELVV